MKVTLTPFIYILRHAFASLILMLVATGCVNDTPDLLRVGSNQWPGYEPIYLAAQKGYYKDTAIRMVEFPNATSVQHAFATGALEVAAVTMDEALTLLDDGTSFKLIALLDISNGADGLVVGPNIPNLNALKGKRVGYEESAVGSLMLSAVLKKANLYPSDLHLITLPVNEHQAAFINHQVDAVITFEPVLSSLIQQGGVLAFSSREVPGLINDVLIARDDLSPSQLNQLQTLLQGHKQALKLLSTDRENALKVMATRLDISAKELDNAYEGVKLIDYDENSTLFTKQTSTLVNMLKDTYRVMRQEKMLLNKHENLDRLVDTSLNKQLYQQVRE